jgi:hypothetical protein
MYSMIFVNATTPSTWRWADSGCGMPMPFLCRMQKPQVQTVYTHSGGARYLLNTHPMNYTNAQAFCNNNGGHLASYGSAAEQLAVETHYIQNGMLLPNFKGHSTYWMGLRTSSWPRFTWLDTLLPAPSADTYTNWGTYMPSNVPEPNNLATGENCAVANFTQSTAGQAWKWADNVCEAAAIFMCKMTPPRLYAYTSKTSASTYYLNTALLSQSAAQGVCNDQGGHLVSWRSLAEQQVRRRGRGFLEAHAVLAASSSAVTLPGTAATAVAAVIHQAVT